MDFISILKEQQDTIRLWQGHRPQVQRHLAPTYQKYLASKQIKVIMGPRRSGKSFFAIQPLVPEETVYINFDDERFWGLQAKDLNPIYLAALQLNPQTKNWVFDEIQNILGWELFVNRLHRKGLNIIVTGSNSKLLSKELATHLTGRTLALEVFPYSWSEYLQFYGIFQSNHPTTEELAVIKNHFAKFLKNGGFPESLESETTYNYLRELFDRIVTKDVVQRYGIRDVRSIKGLAVLLVNYSGSELSYKKLKTAFESMSINTLRKYVNHIADTYLIYEVEVASDKIRERISKSRKVYCVDSGMFNALADNPARTWGSQLETLVFMELKKKGLNISFFKTQGFEVDFVLKTESRVTDLIQVAWDISLPKTRDRELSGLSKGSQHFRCNRLTLLTFDYEEAHPEYTIIPVWKWLGLLAQGQLQL